MMLRLVSRTRRVCRVCKLSIPSSALSERFVNNGSLANPILLRFSSTALVDEPLAETNLKQPTLASNTQKSRSTLPFDVPGIITVDWVKENAIMLNDVLSNAPRKRIDDIVRRISDSISNRFDLSILEAVLEHPVLIQKLFSTNSEMFYAQLESCEFDGSLSELEKLMTKLYANNQSIKRTRISLSPSMVQCIEKASWMEKIAVLESLSFSKTRVVNLLRVLSLSLAKDIASPLASKSEVSIQPLIRTINAISKLNFMHHDILNAFCKLLAEPKWASSMTLEDHAKVLNILKIGGVKHMGFVQLSSPTFSQTARSLQDAIAKANEDVSKKSVLESSMFQSVNNIFNVLASYDISLEEYAYYCNDEAISAVSLNALLKSCAPIHAVGEGSAFMYMKTLALFNCLDNNVFAMLQKKLLGIICKEEVAGNENPRRSFEVYCATLFFRHSLLNGVKQACELWINQKQLFVNIFHVFYIKSRASPVFVAERKNHLPYRLQMRNFTKIFQLEYVENLHLGLGLIADVVKPLSWSKKPVPNFNGVAMLYFLKEHNFKVSPGLKGETRLYKEHIEKLGMVPFVVNPQHWDQLQSNHEKFSYLVAKWTIEVGEKIPLAASEGTSLKPDTALVHVQRSYDSGNNTDTSSQQHRQNNKIFRKNKSNLSRKTTTKPLVGAEGSPKLVPDSSKSDDMLVPASSEDLSSLVPETTPVESTSAVSNAVSVEDNSSEAITNQSTIDPAIVTSDILSNENSDNKL